MKKILFIALFLFAAQSAFAQWADPTLTPPNGNTSTPINVSATAQSKSGGITAGSLVTTGGATITGNLGVGVAAHANSKLKIANNVATGFLDTFAEYQALLYDSGAAGSSYGIGIKGSTIVFNSGVGAYSFDAAGNSTRMAIDTAGDVIIGNDLTITAGNDSTDQGTPSIRSDGSYLILNPRPSSPLYLAWDAGSSVQVGPPLYATILYDRDDSGYYANPNGTSRLNAINVTQMNGTFAGTNSNVSGDLSYVWGYQEAGAWSHPYPDLVLGYHTGLKLGGHYSYSGTRFYNDHPGRGGATEIFSVGNGDNNVRTVYNHYAAAFLYSSDKALKKDIKPLADSLSKIVRLEGVSFKWKDEGKGEGEKVGLIAQDVEKVFPEIVSTDKTTGLKSVEYGNLVAPLIEAIKEQQKQIEDLKKEVAELKADR